MVLSKTLALSLNLHCIIYSDTGLYLLIRPIAQAPKIEAFYLRIQPNKSIRFSLYGLYLGRELTRPICTDLDSLVRNVESSWKRGFT